jgi:hypothetical protein
VTEWVTRQLELLRAQWPDLEYDPAGHWVRIPDWHLPAGWEPSVVDVAFQIKESPDQPPYAFVISAPVITFEGSQPGSWSTGAQVCFPGTWSQFSWAPETWTPTADPQRAPTMVAFARSFGNRFNEGA